MARRLQRHPKPSPSGSVFRSWPQTRYTCTRSSAHPTTTTATSFPTPHQPHHHHYHIPPPLFPPLSVPTGAPKTEPHRLGFRALAQTRRPCAQLSARTTTTTTSLPAPHQPPPSPLPSVPIGAPKIEPLPLSFGFLAQIPNNGANSARFCILLFIYFGLLLCVATRKSQ
jgi:hypothetical protein